MIKIFEAFAGIGTQRMALKRLGVDFEVIAISEIDKFAIKSYKAIHGEVNNLGDITKINTDDLPDFDLFTYSFPCQDISVAGQQKSLEKGSGTRSSLLWECEKTIKNKRPKYLLMENVKNLVGKRHKNYFLKWLEVLENYGYKNFWQVLNAKDYGIPQNRERVFCVSILDKDAKYKFPEKNNSAKMLKDILEDDVDKKFYLSQEQIDKITFSNFNTKAKRIQEKDYCDTLCARDFKDPKCVKVKQIGQYNTSTRINSSRYRVYDIEGIAPSLTTCGGGNLEPHIKIKNSTKKGYLEAKVGDGVDLSYPDSKTRRGRVQKGLSQTLVCSDNRGVVTDDFKIRKLTPLEYWRLMGIDDEDFYKAQKVNSNSQLYKQAGNAIVVDVLEEIFKNLF